MWVRGYSVKPRRHGQQQPPTNPLTLCHCVDLYAAATGVQGQVWASASVESGLKSCARNACCMLDDVT